jgi:hypothetical protein
VSHAARFASRAALPFVALFASRAHAQGIRVLGSSLANFVELRPVVEDSIADSLTTGSGLVRQSSIGLVSCPEGQPRCYYYRSLDRTHTVPLTQDVELTGWGLGQGVSVYAHVRANANGGGAEELWTRENDRFTALAAYVELERDRWSARAGRQWLTSQLGVNNFDGVSASVGPWRRLVVEGYAGASLIQGLSEPLTSSALAAADVLPPDVGGLVFGAKSRWRPVPVLAVGAEYRRELRRDRAGLYSERMAVDAALLTGQTSLTADVEADFATRAVNEARVRLSRPLSHRIIGGIEGVHSTPFFPLWTIWGVFSPVGYDELRADARWHSRDDALSVSLSGGYRRYGDTHTGVGFLPLRDDGWTTIASARWQMRPRWEATGSYRRDIGFGASTSDGNAGIRWRRDDDGASLGATASILQNIFEFRVASGYVAGAAIDAGVPLTPDVRLAAQAGLYRQIAANTPATTVNWSQRRAYLRLDWAIGGDPGMRTPRAPPGAREP